MPVLSVALTAPLELAELATRPDTVLICAANAVSGNLDIRSQASTTGARHSSSARTSQHSSRLHMAARTGQLMAGGHDTILHNSAKRQRLAHVLLGQAPAGWRTAAVQSGLGRAVASVVLSGNAGEQPSGYAVHPAALDASTHTAAALAGGKGADLHAANFKI